MTSDNVQLVPKADYDAVLKRVEECETIQEQLNTEVLQLRDALKQVNAGIKKASDIVESVVWTRDQKIINDLACRLIAKHPTTVTVKYRGEDIIEILTARED